MDTFSVFFESIYNTFKGFEIKDFIDIVLLSYIIYKAIRLVRETRAEQLVKGILLLTVSYFVSTYFELQAMSFLLKNLFQIGIIALIVLFQPELRRILEKVGRAHVSGLNVFISDNSEKRSDSWDRPIAHICEAVKVLAEDKTGALLVLERTTKLGEQIDTGVPLNAMITKELLLNIFVVNTPLHDGAVIVRDGKILAAACFLPKPQKEELIANNLGSRHRAAIGISEISDALTIVVSEETGTISVSDDGKLIRNFTPETLSTFLSDKIIGAKEPEEKGKIRKKLKNKMKNS